MSLYMKSTDYIRFDNERLTLSEKEMKELKNEISDFLGMYPIIKSINYKYTSYGLKHAFERIMGFYISNMDFKEAMRQLGIPNDHTKDQGKCTGLNVSYPISKNFITMAHRKAGARELRAIKDMILQESK